MAAQVNDKREIFGWAMYDFANSAFSTTVGTVFLGPYVASLARTAADLAGTETVSVLGIPVAPDSFMGYCISLSVGLQVLFLPILGAIADYSDLRKPMMRLFATIGAVATMLMFFITADVWWLGGLLFIIANLAFGAAIVFYNAYLPDIASEDQRDKVSSYGWAMGYLGGGLLLFVNLMFYQFSESLGIDGELAVRINLASAGVWWFGFAYYAWRRLRPSHAIRALPKGDTYLTVGFRQLRHTFREAHKYPQTIRYLIAYLVYNDGIQTVIAMAAIFAAAPLAQGGLGINPGDLAMVILMIQFVAFIGALLWGRLALRVGAKQAIIISLVIWSAVVTYGYFGMQGDNRVTEFWIMGACIALVLGGSQAISRSLFAQMIPAGKEAEFFSVYEVSERGTSWIGPLIFSLVNQWTGSLRPALLSLIFFFFVGLFLLTRVNVKQAILDAGNDPKGVVI